MKTQWYPINGQVIIQHNYDGKIVKRINMNTYNNLIYVCNLI